MKITITGLDDGMPDIELTADTIVLGISGNLVIHTPSITSRASTAASLTCGRQGEVIGALAAILNDFRAQFEDPSFRKALGRAGRMAARGDSTTIDYASDRPMKPPGQRPLD